MSEAELPEPLGVGRAADVFDLGDGTVLRRYRADHDAELEGQMMTWLTDHGARVPRVHRAEGRDLVMDRIDGPTMLEDLEARPWMIASHARLLARLQQEINAHEAPAWFPTRDGVTPGDRVLHLDLHPMNVMLGREGPMVIDWTNASRGDPAFDAAMTYVLGSTVETSNVLERVGTPVFMGCFALASGRRQMRAALADAAELRLLDPAVTDGERIAIERLLRRTS